MERALAVAAVLVLASGCLTVQGLQPPQQGTSALADALLDPRGHPVLVVEFGAVGGYQLDQSALVEFQQSLSELTGRKAIHYTDAFVLPPQGGNHTPASLQETHRSTARAVDPVEPVSAGRVQLRVLVLDGHMARDRDGHVVLGTLLAEDGVIVLFPDTYARAHRVEDGVRVPAVAEMDRHVLLHELGHALGLVDRGVPMVRDHGDPENPGHSSNPASLLYHRPPMEGDGALRGPPATFDADDLADLAAYRAALRA